MNNPYKPNTAPIPNILFDYWMAKLTPGEFKVLMAIARKTYGWHKVRDRISLKQITDLTGLHRTGVIKALDNLIDCGLILKFKRKDDFDGGDLPNEYEINTDCKEGVENNEGGSIPSRPPPVDSVDYPPVDSVDPQKTLYTKDTIQKGSKISRPIVATPPKFSSTPPPPSNSTKIEYRPKVHLTEKDYKTAEAAHGITKLSGILDVLSSRLAKKDYNYTLETILPGGWACKAYEECNLNAPKPEAMHENDIADKNREWFKAQMARVLSPSTSESYYSQYDYIIFRNIDQNEEGTKRYFKHDHFKELVISELKARKYTKR